MYLIIIGKIVVLIGFKRGLVLNNYGAALRQLEKNKRQVIGWHRFRQEKL